MGVVQTTRAHLRVKRLTAIRRCDLCLVVHALDLTEPGARAYSVLARGQTVTP